MALILSGNGNVDLAEEPEKSPLLLTGKPFVVRWKLCAPGSRVEALVDHFFEVRNSSGRAEPYVLLPTACVSLILWIRQDGCACEVWGPHRRTVRLEVPAEGLLFGVRLKAGCSDWLTGRSVDALVDGTRRMPGWLQGWEECLWKIGRGISFEERCIVASEWMERQVPGEYRPLPLLTEWMSLAQAQRGICKVSDLACACGCRERTVAQNFRGRVGITPKQYCELLQFFASLRGMLEGQVRRGKDLAESYGYFDVSHMNRTYQKLTGYTAFGFANADLQTLNADEL